jgi:VanZ family protein
MVLRGYWPALAWSLIILLLTGLPGNVFPEIKSFWDWLSPDKVVHLFIFGLLSFLILFGYRHKYSGGSRQKLGWAALGITIVYGALTEILQYYVFIGRSGNVYDAVADMVGAFAGWLAFIPVFKKIKSKTV